VHRQCTVQAAFLVSATFAGRNTLGCTVSTPVKRLLPIAAAPAAVVGIAAAFAFGNTPGAATATADVSGHLQAPTATSPQGEGSASPLVSISRQPATGLPVARLNANQLAAIQPKGKHHRTLPSKYIVKSGDTLASIAQDLYHSSNYWPVLYWANRGTIKYASEIQEGQALAVPAKPGKIPAAPSTLTASPAPATSTVSYAESSSSAGPADAAPVQTESTYTGSSGSFQACVIAAESGGNSQVMNSTGHYGLYQFSASTWAEYGGNPADFGDASVAEQNQVFDNAIAAGGESNWAPYDGC
jgi:LysM repeat protein